MGEVRPDPAQSGHYLVSGELGFSTVPALLERGRSMFAAGASALRLDLGGVSRADSAGLALLIEWFRAARAAGQDIVFINVPPQMFAMARVSGLDGVLPLSVRTDAA